MTEHAQQADVNTSIRKGDKHPAKYQRDLNPHALEGHNWGLEGPHPEKGPLTAEEIKEIHNRFPQFTNDELRRIQVLPSGIHLEQGATYLDLKEEFPHEFTATSDMEATEDHWYVPKTEVDYELWNRLIGVGTPERIGAA